jgi:pyruvate,water dikinase
MRTVPPPATPPTRPGPLLLPLSAVTDEQLSTLVGSKAATLARLAKAGFEVPDGVVLTTAASRLAAEQAGIGGESDLSDVLQTALPEAIRRVLRQVAEQLDGAALAVRSSAVEEDRPASSFAGQYETVLGVRGADELADAVRRCWGSAHSERVRAYRRSVASTPTPHPGMAAMAVLVQRQLEPQTAGVAFTVDPVTGDDSHVVVSATTGLGEAVVSGQVTPDEWRVPREGGPAEAVRLAHGALSEPQARLVASAALRAEALLGTPQDVEWAFADGRLYLLQSRPVTSAPAPPRASLPGGVWFKDASRYADPVTAFGAAVALPGASAGLAEAFATAGCLLDRIELRCLGGEVYSRPVPLAGGDGPPPPWWVLAVLARIAPPLRARMRRARDAVRDEVITAQLERWQSAIRPALAQDVEQLRSVNLSELDDGGVEDHLTRCVAVTRHALAEHFRLLVPYLVPVHRLVIECERLLGWDAARTMELLSGDSPASSAPARAMADVAQLVSRRADVTSIVLATSDAPEQVLRRLPQVDPESAQALDAWCDRYGGRVVNDDPGSPVLSERPAVVLSLLRSALLAHGGQDDAPPASAARRHEASLAAARELDGRSARDLQRFERALAAARRAYPVREDNVFWLTCAAGTVRTALLQVGRRLADRGDIAAATDVVLLSPDQVLRSLTAPRHDLRAVVARERAERAWVAHHPGPAQVGGRGYPPPDVRGLPRAGREVNEALLWMQADQSRQASDGSADPRAHDGLGDASALVGVPASAGIATGTVRVVLRESDFERLAPGDVLVCPTTDPGWSVLFGVASALVTDGGGVLSHAAIIAREHGIPAVVAVPGATRCLRDGDVVTDDGAAGTVHRHGPG